MKRLALVGPMGVGKTTVGRYLSERLHIPFVDLDQAIEAATGAAIPELFNQFGESAFRELELRQLDSTTRDYPGGCVCATGGGIVVTEACRQVLSENWIAIWLTAEVDTLVTRLATESAGRPMLRSEEPLEQRIRLLMESRCPYYREVSKYCFHVDGRGVDEIVEDIVNWLTSHGDIDIKLSSTGVLQDGATH